MRDGEVQPFNELQQRLNRKTVTPAMLQSHPAHIRLYDMLIEDEEDLRPLPSWNGDKGSRVGIGGWSRRAPTSPRCSHFHPWQSWRSLVGSTGDRHRRFDAEAPR